MNFSFMNVINGINIFPVDTSVEAETLSNVESSKTAYVSKEEDPNSTESSQVKTSQTDSTSFEDQGDAEELTGSSTSQTTFSSPGTKEDSMNNSQFKSVQTTSLSIEDQNDVEKAGQAKASQTTSFIEVSGIAVNCVDKFNF